ncbi:MAG: membrane dipeptidase [Porphyromonadaceae bacterium]|nr:membrane dipeptidase [Porphyromonadaceae bacterium]
MADPYVEAVIRAGGVPLLLPVTTDPAVWRSVVVRLDGLLLTGGGDFSAAVMGNLISPLAACTDAERDVSESLLLRLALQRQLPVFGICRGLQLMNLVLGGTIYQDLPSEYPKDLLTHSQKEDKRRPVHEVSLAEGSLLLKLSGKNTLRVNSLHHQAVDRVAPSLRVSAVAPDGVLEAIESPYYPLYGVQWHPEQLLAGGDVSALRLFSYLVEEARLYRQVRTFHEKYISLDSHCDTPMFFPERIEIGRRDSRLKVDLPKMEAGGLDATCMVAYLPQGRRDAEGCAAATAQADATLDELSTQIAKNVERVEQAFVADDVARLKAMGKKAIFMGIENGYAIGRDISNVERFRRKGVVYMTLCHNGDNDICDSAKGENEHNGLSPFGRKVVREMNRVGMMVDLAHAGEKSFYDALEVSRTPIVSTHSSCRALCDHPRNLTDDQIRSLAAKGGVIQICLYEGFLVKDGKSSIEDIVAHIDHVVALVGVDYVGIGSDFDGGGGIPGCDTAEELMHITKALFRKGYTTDMLQKIWGGNFLRVMRQVQAAAE